MDYNKQPPKIKLLICGAMFQQGGTFDLYPRNKGREYYPRLYISLPDRESYIFFRSTVDPEFDLGDMKKTHHEKRFLFQINGMHRCLPVINNLLPYLSGTKRIYILTAINEHQEYLNNPLWRPPKPTPPFSTDNEDAI